ncbi:MAG TPA: NlpC/P60 family protein [Flavobacterium sp.]|jgi:cell wall-associated NlpC family hydrolase
MFSKTLLNFVLPLILLTAYSGNSQVVTSKKEAVKKGIYQKPAQSVKPATSVAEKTVAAVVGKTVKPAPKQVVKSSKPRKPLITETEDKDLLPIPKENYLALQMINNAMTFIGVRYSGGGTTKAGMDCSGMVTAVANIFDLKLPRSSNEMAKVGKKLDQKEIQKGDLVFFKTNGKSIINHVGMVIEVIGDEIKFVHSSTSKGVIVSSTKEPYYGKTFAQANRIL